MTRTAPIALSRRLREETRARHAEVETGTAFNRLVVVRLPQADPSDARVARARAEYREVYRRFLVAAHGFEVAVDAAIAAAPVAVRAALEDLPAEFPPPGERIHDDLRWLAGTHAADALPAMTELPRVATMPEALAVAYVRGGSRAGGAVIGAAARHNLAITPEAGGAFLLAQGKGTSASLEALRRWLDGFALDEPSAAATVAAANATFVAVGRWHRRVEAAGRA